MITKLNITPPSHIQAKLGFKAVSKPVQEFIDLTKAERPNLPHTLIPILNHHKYSKDDLDAFEKSVKDEKNWKAKTGFKETIKEFMLDYLEENGRKVD